MIAGETTRVLDHGYVRYIAHMGSDEAIIEAARMSTGKGFEGWEKDARLLEFLWSNQHATPFEMCELAIEVQAPLMVFREWHRHRTQSYNEFSARYAQMPDLHYLPSLERVQKQSTANKQGAAEQVDPEVAKIVLESLEHQQGVVYQYYDSLVNDLGIAKEVARLNTPVSRYSKMRAKTDLRNWLAFLQLRMAPNAQWEIRQYANAVAAIVADLFPRTWALFEEHTLYSVRLSRREAAELRAHLSSGGTLSAAITAKLFK